MKTVRVNAGSGYDVLIGSGLAKNCGGIVKDIVKNAKLAVVTDSNVSKLYLDTVISGLEEAGVDAVPCVFSAGEENKNLSTLSDILEFMAEKGLTRSDYALALGGGVVGDVTGFAAGCYMRGINYIQMPTTLLAAVDSSVGGKTAVDLSKGKNLAGLFLQPRAVICDTDILSALPGRIFADGAAEAVKTGVLGNEELFGIFEEGRAKEDISMVIESCVRYKGRIVELDEKESGLRKLLNLGHTVGHAVEALSGFNISHGHAVSVGMAYIAGYSYAKGICSKDCFLRIVNTLVKNDLPVTASYGSDELAKAIISDKKRKGNNITLILPRSVGECIMQSVDISELRSIIELGREALS